MVCSYAVAVVKMSSSYCQFGDARVPHDAKKYMSAKSDVSRKADLTINSK